MLRKIHSPILSFCLLGFSALHFPLAADDAIKVPNPFGFLQDRDWQSTLDFGGIYREGNSDVFNLRGSWEAVKEDEVNTWLLGLEGAYGKANGVLDTRWARSYGKWNRDLSGSWYTGLYGELLHDEPADLDYRASVAPLLGYVVWENEQSSLELEAGPAYVIEQQGGISDRYLALRFTETFEYYFNERMKVWQSLEFSPQIDDLNNFQFIGEAGIETVLSDQWSVKTYFQTRYDNDPAAGRESNDSGAYLALSYGVGKMGEAGSAAAASAALKEAGDGWNWVGVLGASYLSGNSDTTLITSGIQALKTDNDRESGLGFSLGYSEVTSVTTANRYDAYAFHNRDLNQRWHFGARANYQKHQIAGLDYRIDFGPHIGYRLVDTEETKLRIEGGLSYTLEDQIVRGEFASLRFGQFLTHKLTDRTDLVQSMEYLSAVDDFSNWNGSASLGVVSAMTDRIKWSNEIVYDFDNVPATGFQKADLSIVSGIKWSF